MNRITFGMFVAILVNLSGYAELKLDPQYRKAVEGGAATRIDVHVIDDEGAPVRDAEVKAVFAFQHRERSETYVSDSNGVAVVEGITTGHYVELNLSKAGYYDSKVKYRYLRLAENHPVKDCKWQPWGKEVRIVLRKIRSPIKMVHLSKNFLMPATNSFIGFDMEVADWVKPYGKGEYADFCIKYFGDGIPVPNYKRIGCVVAFTNCFCGAYIERKFVDSEFKTPYVAKTNAHYQTSFEYIRKIDSAGQMYRRELADAEDLVVRTRCVVDNEGRLVKCNYGRIGKIFFNTGRDGSGETLLEYDFNPTPSDTNLEPKR